MRLPIQMFSTNDFAAAVRLVEASGGCSCYYDDRDGCVVSTDKCRRGLSTRCRLMADPEGGHMCTCQCK